MFDWLEKHWPQVTAFVVVVLGYGKLQWDVKDLKKKDFVTKELCGLHRGGCSAENRLMFENGKEKFDEIQTSMTRLEDKFEMTIVVIERKLEDVHRDMVDKLIAVIQQQQQKK